MEVLQEDDMQSDIDHSDLDQIQEVDCWVPLPSNINNLCYESRLAQVDIGSSLSY